MNNLARSLLYLLAILLIAAIIFFGINQGITNNVVRGVNAEDKIINLENLRADYLKDQTCYSLITGEVINKGDVPSKVLVHCDLSPYPIKIDAEEIKGTIELGTLNPGEAKDFTLKVPRDCDEKPNYDCFVS